MRTLLLQDWVTVRSAGSAVVQDQERWLELDGFSDITCWIDVAEVTPPGGTATNSVQLQLQTSPTADDSYFVPSAPTVSFGSTAQFLPASTTPLVLRSGRTPLGNNLGRCLRWQLSGSGSGLWDMTFRIRVVGHRSTAFTPALLPNLQLWYRADLGSTVGASPFIVSSWNDESQTNDLNKNLTYGASTLGPTITYADVNYLGQTTMQTGADAHSYFASGTWTSTVNQPHTLILVGHRTSAAATTYFTDGIAAGTAASVFISAAGIITMGAGGSITGTAGNSWLSPSAFLGEFNSASGTSKMFFNDFTTPLAMGNAGAVGFDGVSLGVHSIGFGGGNVWPGTIAEVIDYSAILTTNQKAQIRQYLRGRYGLLIA
jgi:hypothetical protein